MRISLISAAVCCALFSAYGASAAPLTVEQRLALLEARLNHAEQEAGEAKRRAQQAELRTSAAEQRAAAAESRCRRSVSAPQRPSKSSRTPTNSWRKAASAMASSSRLRPLRNVSQQPRQSARGGPGISPASSLNGDAHVGRLGNEKDNYAELSFGKKLTFNDGSWARFKTMLADGATNGSVGSG